MVEQILIHNGYELAALIFSLCAGLALMFWSLRTNLSFTDWHNLSKEERKRILDAVLNE